MKISQRPEFNSKKPPLTYSENDSVLLAVKAHEQREFLAPL